MGRFYGEMNSNLKFCFKKIGRSHKQGTAVRVKIDVIMNAKTPHQISICHVISCRRHLNGISEYDNDPNYTANVKEKVYLDWKTQLDQVSH